MISSLPVFKPHADRHDRINSAKLAIRTILPLDLYAAHKKELLSVCIWKITQADGKAKVRFWSEGALGSDKKELRHEHVFERKELIQRLLEGEEIELVLSDAIACMVTKPEHLLLGKIQASGWVRYEKAGIRVYDSLENQWSI
jgi:hypothetical protein